MLTIKFFADKFVKVFIKCSVWCESHYCFLC